MINEFRAIYKNDPAARGIEAILYPGLHAIIVHKYITHNLYRVKLKFVARLVSQIMRFLTGIEIHPGATFGKGLFIDHGIGIVIGETVVIGDWCTIFHNVTLGGTGNITGKRHPSVGNNVLIGANATILGNLYIGNNSKIGAESVIVNRDIPENATVVGAPGKIVKLDGERVSLELKEKTYDGK